MEFQVPYLVFAGGPWGRVTFLSVMFSWRSVIIVLKCSVFRACPFPGPFATQNGLLERLFLLASTGSSELPASGIYVSKRKHKKFTTGHL